MRIGIDAQRVFRPHKHGMDFVALETIRNLQQIDKENEYFIFVNEGEDTGCLTETPNFKIVTFGGNYALWEQVRLPRMVKKYRCELLHCTSNTAPVNCPVPLVVTVHDIIYFETNPLFAKDYTAYQRFGNLYRRFVVRINLRQAKKIITVSEFEKDRFLKKLKLPSEKVEVIYNGVGKHFFTDREEAGAREWLKKSSLPQPYILFLGNTDPKKNTPNTIQAFARLCEDPGFGHTLVVADLDRNLALKLLREEKLEKHIDRIHFTGYIPNNQLPYAIAGADLFLYPSLRESFGIPILEAMASGTPVITSTTSSMPEIAGNAAILVDPSDQGELMKAVKEVLSDHAKAAFLKEAGKERASAFDWRQTAEKTLFLYKSILSGS